MNTTVPPITNNNTHHFGSSRDDPPYKKIEPIVATTFGRGLSVDEVKKLNASVNALVQEIQRKEK